MIKSIALVGGFMGLAVTMPTDDTPPPFPSLETNAKLLWKTEIGVTTFRNNVLLQGDRLWIGSNGDDFMDYSGIDASSGIYALDRKTGKKIIHYANELFGDMDVTGILMHQNKIYFGNDNEEFLCTDATGKILWRIPTSGDVEHEPVLIQGKAGPSIVYATESGEVRAVDPETGNTRWDFFVEGFEGWRPGQNRTQFKVKAWFNNTWAFYTKPIVTDLNLDGVNDLLYRLYSGNLIVLDGNSGRKIWNPSKTDKLSLGAGVLGKGKDKRIVGLNTSWDENDNVQTECVMYNTSGKKLKSLRVSENSYGDGLNALVIDQEHILLNGENISYLVNIKGEIQEVDRRTFYTGKDWDGKTKEIDRNWSDALFGDQLITLGNGKKGVVVMNQHDRANFKVGFVEILSLDDRSVLARFSLPCGSEMPPVIRDVNLDGKQDMLIGGYDGFLYCFELPKL